MNLYKMKLAASVSLMSMLVSMPALSSQQFSLSGEQPTAVVELAGVTDGMYIVRLSDQPIATYDGGVAGLQATSARANGKKKLNTKSKAAKKYQAHLRGKQKAILDKAGKQFGRKLSTKYDYHHAINGFAVALTVDEAKALKNMDGVVSVQREREEIMLTDVGPAWIGAPEVWSNGNLSTQGEGMVIAVLDSGINSDQNQNFRTRYQNGDGYEHTNHPWRKLN